MPNSRFVPSLVLCALAAGIFPATLRADEKPPLTKEQERQKFHPRRLGMSAADRNAGYARRQEMEKASHISAIRFRSVGPEIQGGRVVEIAAPANHPDSLVVAFASGGLWRTDDRGGAWTPLFDDEPTLTIGSFALADPDGRTIYVGTGESNSSRTSYAGTGMFKTTDAGKTWQPIGLADTHHIGKVVVDPRDTETVYVAAVGHLYTENPERGVFVTRDGGKTWSKTLFVDDRTGAIDLVQDPEIPTCSTRRRGSARARPPTSWRAGREAAYGNRPTPAGLGSGCPADSRRDRPWAASGFRSPPRGRRPFTRCWTTRRAGPTRRSSTKKPRRAS